MDRSYHHQLIAEEVNNTIILLFTSSKVKCISKPAPHQFGSDPGFINKHIFSFWVPLALKCHGWCQRSPFVRRSNMYVRLFGMANLSYPPRPAQHKCWVPTKFIIIVEYNDKIMYLGGQLSGSDGADGGRYQTPRPESLTRILSSSIFVFDFLVVFGTW